MSDDGIKLFTSPSGFVLVSACDFEWAARHKWWQDKFGYAIRSVRRGGKKTSIRLHREIIGAKPGEYVDHANGSPSDNRRGNLRICDNRRNQQNKRKRTKKTSQYKGVCWHKWGKKWQADIFHDGKSRHLGCFIDEVEAAKAYDAAALKYFGEFACPNFPFRKMREGVGT